MQLKFSSIIIIFLSALIVQGCSVGARIKKADKRYEVGEYFVAADLYKRAYSSVGIKDKPLKARLAFQQAECYRYINSSRAEQTYPKAIRYNYPDSIVYLRYAQVLHRNAKYADAAKNYKIYLEHDSGSIVAKNGLLAINQIAEWRQTPVRYKVSKSKEFNVNRSSSFCPAFVGKNSDLLVFTSTRKISRKTAQKNSAITGLPINNIFITRKNAAGKWETPELLEGEVNSINDNGVSSFTSDGKKMYFTQSPYIALGDRGTEIYESNRAGGTWSAPRSVNIFNDSTVSVAHPAISPDDQTIYFVTNEIGGLGGKDIWKAKLENGECKYIENLGPEINTSGDEMFPSVREDGVLYFSSNGRVGYGGLDIYRATPKKEGGWVVENMGEPINSNNDDFGITFESGFNKGYFSSNRNEIRGYDNIWSFELPVLTYFVQGKVLDEKNNPVPDAVIKLVSNNGLNERVQAKKDGSYKIKLDKDQECVMLASARGYLNQKNEVSTAGATESQNLEVNFKLSTISKPIKLENIFYEFAKWDLTPESESGLQVLVKILKDNPNITIEISANTDFVGANVANQILSEKRANSVVNYLIKAGIAPQRLTSVGYGEENPVVVDAQQAQKYPFLKENDVLNESFVQNLTSEQKEIVNQINRRTEFRVLKTTYNLY
ncbi:MAG: OmpA family protein [Paludibacter sp.]|nr:OmpA family protein [Paludibacter sp.]